MPTIEVTDATFEQKVLKSDKPVLVDFWAAWCAPCRMVAPILEELSNTYVDALTIAKLDVDKSAVIAPALRIQSIPTMVLFADGRPVKSVQGALPKEMLVRFIEQYVPSTKKPSISVEELAQRLKQNAPVTVIDIRDPRDFSRSHLRHARCAPPEQVADVLHTLEPGTLVVLICRTGEKSAELAAKLANETKHEVVALVKGLLEWEGAGHPTYSDKEEAKLDQLGG
jgi:thioredoxin 1